MQTITTRVLPCTNTKPTRIKAQTTSGVSIIISAPIEPPLWSTHEYDAHDAAMQRLCEKLDNGHGSWVGREFIRGSTNEGCVYVLAYDKRIKG
jgi:hypothetical protein